MFLESYIRQLERQIAERAAKRAADAKAAEAAAEAAADAKAAARADPRAALRAQVTRWYSALLPEARAPRYLLEDLVKLFGATPQQLGLALDELGWRRKRVWLNDGPHRRYWFPPDQ